MISQIVLFGLYNRRMFVEKVTLETAKSIKNREVNQEPQSDPARSNALD